MSLQKIFDFEAIHSLRHSVLDTESVNVGYFIIGVCATPSPAPNILSFLLRRKKERTLDKKEKQRRLKTVTKFNSKLVNSLSLRQHEFFHCFIK